MQTNRTMSSAGISISASSESTTAREAWTMTIAIGFATTVALWGVCYFTLMGPGLAVGEALFALMLVVLGVGGFFGARCREITARGSGSAALAGMRIGLVSAVANLLIVGSLFRDASVAEMAGWLLGLFVVSMGLGAVGGAIGGLKPAFARAQMPSALALFAAVLACAILLLLVSGGLVTGLEAGLAVPDWPNSFGHNMLLYPLRDMTGGIFFEHAHRLYGMLVGVGTMTLVALVILNDSRGWLRGTAVLLLLMVIVQGIMGGLRVTELSVSLAVVHGIFGQMVFVIAVLLAACTTRAWRETGRTPHDSTETDRALMIGLLVVLILQLVLGACVRHLQVFSEETDRMVLPNWALYLHVLVGLIAFVVAILAGFRGWSAYPDIDVVRRLGKAIVIVVSLQFLLGLVALIVVLIRTGVAPPAGEVVMTSLHQATGAVLLACAVLLVAWHKRLLVPLESDPTS